LNKVDLKLIQHHGKEDNEYIRSLRNKNNENNKIIEIWKAVSIDNIDKIKKFNNEIYEYKDNNNKLIRRKLIDKYLIDGVNPGSGQEYSLNTLDYIPEEAKIFLAGGINPNNVKEKIKAINPFGIDVSSGVEYIDEHGLRKKSYEKIKLLIENAKK
ncbi:MAG TPA: N-(5'-phosphoribosyl)anthranilate isomerase, partial [Clostridium sp.]|nr:N-(5'-phosphoribosyl)anthranilate isomerase [Clostridium sp.]